MKRKCIFSILVLVFLLIFSSHAFAIEGYPGHTWGDLTWEIPRTGGTPNLTLEGWIEQGIHWVSWGNLKLNTYASLRYKWDEEKFDWNNKISPGVGVALELYSPKQIHVRTGIEYLWERFYVSGHEEQKVYFYVTWYGWWDLKKKH